MTILSRLKRSGVNAEAGNRPYVSTDDYPTQMRKRTQKAVNDISPQVQSELVRPYKQPSYQAHEYYQVPPPGIEPWPGPTPWDPIPIMLQVATPIFSVASGSYSSVQTVQIVCLTAGATIYYTLDNTEPTVHKTKYTIPLVISANTILKTRAFKDGMDASNVAIGIYKITVGWTSYFNNIRWTVDGPFGFGSWDGTKWNSEASGPPETATQLIYLEPIGSWFVGFRPTKVRVTHTATAGLGDLSVFDTDINQDGYLAYPSLEELIFINVFSTDKDILVLSIGSEQGADPYSITNIEFYL